MNYYINSKIGVSDKITSDIEFNFSDKDLQNIAGKHTIKCKGSYDIKNNPDLQCNLKTAIWIAHKKFDKNKGKTIKSYIIDHLKWEICDFYKNSRKNREKYVLTSVERPYSHTDFNNIDDINTVNTLIRKTILTDKEKMVIKMKFYEDMTSQQIASTMEITKSYVNQILKGALLELKNSAARLRIRG